MTDLLLVGGPNDGRQLHGNTAARETLYTMTADGPCCYQRASSIARGESCVELYLCENLPKAEGERLLADMAKNLQAA